MDGLASKETGTMTRAAQSRGSLHGALSGLGLKGSRSRSCSRHHSQLVMEGEMGCSTAGFSCTSGNSAVTMAREGTRRRLASKEAAATHACRLVPHANSGREAGSVRCTSSNESSTKCALGDTASQPCIDLRFALHVRRITRAGSDAASVSRLRFTPICIGKRDLRGEVGLALGRGEAML